MPDEIKVDSEQSTTMHQDDGVSNATLEASIANLQAISIRPLKFWSHAPALWFKQMENMFYLASITTEVTKYRHVISNLDWEQLKEIQDIIDRDVQTIEAPYKLVKEHLISRLSNSQNFDIKQMLEREQLGDRKPSQLLRELQRLGHKKVTDEFIRTIWTSRLPDQLQPVLATQPPDTTLEKLGVLADTVFDLVPQQQFSQINATTSGIS
ncbi:uncharacterized protein LOC122506405 [Leptopilina heterotoma]|uniref:uncharacterized protein LOC122506405 n=1 Tax=Leptopilina heterotoma TaxID=63436 RepID=UPI001CA8BAB3|nr:uncharacterized protein LOC122506405 [Leptopilina heterotoma]